MQKGFSIVLVLVVIALLAAVGGGAYYLGTQKAIQKPSGENKTLDVKIVSPSPTSTPQPSNEMTNWKSVKAKELTFQIPNDWWNSGGSQSADVYSMLLNPTSLPAPSDAVPAFAIEISSIQPLNEKIKNLEELWGLTDIKESNLSQSGVDIKVLEGTTKAGMLESFRLKMAIIDNGKNIYVFYDYARISNNNEMFDKILATFKFN